ncbi:MAG: DUF368 domain-containing protein [Candidatus Woesearchaeota archaeon]
MTRFTRAIAHAGRGLAVGVADLVPGVSGATIALILGIYEKLILEISGLIRRPRRFSDLRENLTRDWTFLILTGMGVATAVLLGSHIIPRLVANHPLIVFSLFSGLIASSAVILARGVHGTKRQTFWLISGALIGAGIAMSPVGIDVPVTNTSTIIAGFFAIGAMLIPGISGSYVLVLLGYYTHVFTAISTFDIGFLSFFALGAAGGALSAVTIISRLLKKYHTQTMLLLIGLVAGALGRPLGIAVEAASTSSDIIVLVGVFCVGVLLTTLLMHLGTRRS